MSELITYLRTAFMVYNWILLIRILLSWVPHDPRKPVFNFIYSITEPYLLIFRRIFAGRGAIDFSPVIAIIVLQLLENLVMRLLVNL